MKHFICSVQEFIEFRFHAITVTWKEWLDFGVWVCLSKATFSFATECVFDLSAVSLCFQYNANEGSGNIFGNEIVVESIYFLGCAFFPLISCHRKFMCFWNSYDHCLILATVCSACVWVYECVPHSFSMCESLFANENQVGKTVNNTQRYNFVCSKSLVYDCNGSCYLRKLTRNCEIITLESIKKLWVNGTHMELLVRWHTCTWAASFRLMRMKTM